MIKKKRDTHKWISLKKFERKNQENKRVKRSKYKLHLRSKPRHRATVSAGTGHIVGAEPQLAAIEAEDRSLREGSTSTRSELIT